MKLILNYDEWNYLFEKYLKGNKNVPARVQYFITTFTYKKRVMEGELKDLITVIRRKRSRKTKRK